MLFMKRKKITEEHIETLINELKEKKLMELMLLYLLKKQLFLI